MNDNNSFNNLDDIENIPTIITNIHIRKKEDDKNNYYI